MKSIEANIKVWKKRAVRRETLSAFMFIFLLWLVGFNVSCYSFKGISIDPNIKSFGVTTFENTAPNAPPTLALEFTEKLKDKVRTETPLQYKLDNPDCVFTGRVTDYRVTPVAPKPGEVVALNRLEIKMRVLYTVNIEKVSGTWPNERDFSFFAEFASDRDLLTVQNQLIEEISKQILEDIFNAAFNDW